jgi:hypothetical protein
VCVRVQALRNDSVGSFSRVHCWEGATVHQCLEGLVHYSAGSGGSGSRVCSRMWLPLACVVHAMAACVGDWGQQEVLG